MRKTDINKLTEAKNAEKDGVAVTIKAIVKIVGKGLLTLLTIFFITGIIVSVSLASFIYSMKDSTVDYDLKKLKLNYTSFIYANGENDDSSKPVKYQGLYTSENRVWVDYDQIPKAMKDAIVAIEDKRFWEHQGVDWYRTAGAVTQLFTKGGSYGGSTITQQLIKNVTGESDVSLTRKVTEIFRALNLEKQYSKQEILGAYLNVVNFGSGSNGVQAAANLYFGKNIQDCDIAECAAIAGITQNPAKYSPLAHADLNKERQRTVLEEMHTQGKITDAEYKQAMTESQSMKFVGRKVDDSVSSTTIWNWYIDALFEDVRDGLMKKYSCTSEKAVDMIYHDGLKIYAAMNSDLQNFAEKTFQADDVFGSSQKLQSGYVAMDYSGRVLATVGARGKKTGNRNWSNAIDAKRQPGSTIKPMAIYAPAVESGKYNYSTIVDDNPLPNWFGAGKPGPNDADNKFLGLMPMYEALERSRNAAAAQIGSVITPNVSFTFLKNKLNFTSLVAADNDRAPMAVGGLSEGVTVREMTAGYQMFANGGKYYQPYTFYHVDDHDGNVILDNRNQISKQVLSSETATIVHRMMNTVVAGSAGTGRLAQISGWEVFGKTGTTNDNKDSWFVGGTPYMLAGMWTGFPTPATLSSNQQTYAKTVWKTIMVHYLNGKKKIGFTYDSNVVSRSFCRETGLIANSTDTSLDTGWYVQGQLPAVCNGVHPNASSVPSSSQQSAPASSAITQTPSSQASTQPPVSSSPAQPQEPTPTSPGTSSGGTASLPSSHGVSVP